MITREEMRAVLLQAFPPGQEDFWDVRNRASDVSKYIDALADCFLEFGADRIEQLRAESLPSSATDGVPDWEAVLQLANSRTTQLGTLDGRRLQIVSRLREFGAPTPANIKAALHPILGYEPTVLETSRDALTVGNLYSLAQANIIAHGSTTYWIPVADNAPASKAGVMIKLLITHNSIEDLSCSLVVPGVGTITWAAPFGSGAVTNGFFVLYAPSLAGTPLQNPTIPWVFTVTNSGGNTGTAGGIVVNVFTGAIYASGLLVEGIGRTQSPVVDLPGLDGLGAPMFYWVVEMDYTLMTTNATPDDVLWIVNRWNPAHARGFVALSMADNPGVFIAEADDARALADYCICG